MNIPLYDENNAPRKKPEFANTGLWYDKFCCQWWIDKSRESIWTLAAYKQGKMTSNPKMDWIKSVINQKVGETQLIDDACCRQREMVSSRTNQQCEPIRLKTQWHFVTGLGRQHPTENGFTWHQTLGVPYLPGSSVKGIVRSWVSQWADGISDEDIKRIFGPRDDKNIEKPGAGSVVFLDALPITSVQLKIDVMTPHYDEYYANGEPPGDWINPVPIPFLVVDKNQTFQFALLPRDKKRQSKKDLETALAWLSDAFEMIGAGAKTSAGYGRMKEDESEKYLREKQAQDKKNELQKNMLREALEEEADKDSLMGIAREIFILSKEEKWLENKSMFQNRVEEYIPVTAKEADSSIKRSCLKLFVSHIESYHEGIMNNPDRINEKKKKKPNFYKNRPRELAKKVISEIEKSDFSLDDLMGNN